MAFWYSWPSWVTELVGGFTLTQGISWLVWGGGRLFHHHIVLAVCALAGYLLGSAISQMYEHWWDRNGYSRTDVGQRQLGITVGFLVATALTIAFGV